ncbi:MAG: D-2-hydroxyacid dehydrogenase [Prevotella sp.]|nr:D-2-hydroxyacid dehydrogenase [Prevotella sp.]
MKIVVLDGYTAVQNDLSWKEIEPLGDVTVYDRTCPEETVDRCAGAEAVLTNKVIMSEDVINHLPSLKYIGVLATGYNVVDIEVAHKRGIVVTNIPAYSTQSVAQMVFAHILNAAMQVNHYAEENRMGRWARSEDFCWMDTPVMELCGKTLGIVGLGNIGSTVASIAHAFGMKVIAQTSKAQEQLPIYINKVTDEELFQSSDIITLHCPLTDNTREMICAESIGKMKKGVIVVNTGRGPLVNEQDMAAALKEGRVGAFCADVLSVEPPSADNPLFSCPNAFISPHIAWASHEARARLIHVAAQNLCAFISGQPQNTV